MATAARSPSPAAARAGCPMRRSADSNPFNPADCPQRSSSKGGGGCGCHASPRRRSLGEKENNDQRDEARATPKPACPVGAKNFMSPTISATSKAVAPSASPSRKKVLGERNDEPHLAPFSPANLAHKPKGTPDPRRLRLSFDGLAPAPPPPPAPEAASHGSRRSLAGDDARTEGPVRVSVDHQHAAAADSVDAEPSRAALYDPKTNYTSPRPRFLHYKPNPRVEMYRHGGGGVRRLEEGFASESSEETDATTTEDDLTEEEQDQAHHSHLSEEQSALAAPSEAAAPDEACVLPPESAPGSPGPPLLSPEPAVTSEPPRVFAAEPTATSPPTRALTPEPELGVRSVRAPARKRSSLRFLFPLALVLFTAAFVCVCLPPDSPIMSNTALSKATDFLSVQELHPVELAAWLKQWSSSSLDSITSYWEAFISTQEQEYFGPHFAANWSAAAVDGDHGADFYYNFAEALPMPSEEPISANVLTAEPEGDVVVEEEVQMSEEAPGYYGDSMLEEQLMIEDVVSEASNADLSAELEGVVVEELDVGASEEAAGSNGEDRISFSQDLDIPSEPTGQGEQDVESDESKDNHGNGKEGQEPYLGLESDSSMWPSYLYRISKPAAAGVALVVVVLSAVIAVLSMRKEQAQVATSVHVPAEQHQTRSGSASSEDHRLGKSPQFQSSVAEETQRFGDSGFSQYSSSLSSGHGGRKTKEEENISLEPTSKRESMSYSTSSYGSFTTYEKIAAKNRNKEDEAMTPVRRSSRLRSVKSPEA